MSGLLDRRGLVLAGLGLLMPTGAFAAPSRLAFHVFRNGTKVGEHEMSFAGDDASRTVSTNVAMTVKLGPVPVYKYKHSATERWTAGRFASLDTTTNANGKMKRVTARATASAVQIDGPSGAVRGPADAAPLTHWNPAVFGRPLFNPQEGKMLNVRCVRVRPGQWQVRGEAEIDDFYDGSGTWTALKGKLEDGSSMEYRRV